MFSETLAAVKHFCSHPSAPDTLHSMPVREKHKGGKKQMARNGGDGVCSCHFLLEMIVPSQVCPCTCSLSAERAGVRVGLGLRSRTWEESSMLVQNVSKMTLEISHPTPFMFLHILLPFYSSMFLHRLCSESQSCQPIDFSYQILILFLEAVTEKELLSSV